MKTIKVRTSYIGCPYITAGKVYKTVESDTLGQPVILSDDGIELSICLDSCGHLDDHAWEILPEGPSMEDELAEALQKGCVKYSATLCAHDETHRGGLIWEICHYCGMKWADDEGGKPPFKENETLLMAESILAKYKESTHGKA